MDITNGMILVLNKKPELFYMDFAYLFVFRHINPDIKPCYISKVKMGNSPKKAPKKYLSKLLEYDSDINNWENVFFKKIKYGSGLEVDMIKNYYGKQIGAINIRNIIMPTVY